MTPISIVIIASNAGSTIERCLKSVQGFNEVVLYLNNTTDNTAAIAATFTNVKVVDGEFTGFGPTKNEAASHAQNDWIFTLDSDEELTESLVKELQSLSLEPDSVYSVGRINHYDNVPVLCCGWHPDTVIRLYNRQSTGYTDAQVHEKIITASSQIKELAHPLKHYPYDSISSLLKKADSYSTLFAKANAHKKKSSIFKACLHGIFGFFKHYVLKRGVMYGYNGFVISSFNALGSFLKYLKLEEENRR